MPMTSNTNNRAITLHHLLFFFFLLSASLILQNGKVFASSDQTKSFKRPDPLRHFEYYDGVYNVTYKHYWAVRPFLDNFFFGRKAHSSNIFFFFC